MVNEKLETMKEEVMEINKTILKACEGNEKLKNIYKGCIIYLSPLFENPEILFFGINPGDGYYRDSGKIIQSFDPQTTQNHEGIPMFLDFEDSCRKINKGHLIRNVVKTNRYFFATHNSKELDDFFALLPQEFRYEVLYKQEEWTRMLINELSPKLIIAGGKSIWERFNKLYPNPECVEESKNIKVLRINNIPLIAYQRKFNKMVGKKEFIQFLDKYTQK
jgi:hypothetical protein